MTRALSAVDESAGPAARRAVPAFDVVAAAAQVRAAVAETGMRIGGPSGPVPLHVDPVPRVVSAQEWSRLAAGLAQRVRALEAFLREPAEAVRAGVVPADVLETCLYREGAPPPAAVPLGVAGPDVVRTADGELAVLEDNLRTPTLMGYAQAVAECVRRAVPPQVPLRSAVDGLLPALRRVLDAAAPEVDEPVVAVLGDDRGSNVRWEPALIARGLGVPLVDLPSLTARGDRLLLPDGRAVDVLWRRTSEERLLGDDGRPNRYGLALLPGLRAGVLQVVNPFGTGLADDKRVHPAVDDLVRLHLGEEPLLRSVRGYDLGRPEQRAAAFSRLDDLVLKPRTGSGGHGVSVPGSAGRDRVLREVRRDPASWVAQEVVALSTCSTLVDGALAPRPVDLRPCVLSDGRRVTVLPGGLTRVALSADGLVNCSQGGGAKDTWVLAD